MAAAVVPAQVRADRAKSRFQRFECDDAGQVPASFFCAFDVGSADEAPPLRRSRQVMAGRYCGRTEWNIDLAASSMSSATLVCSRADGSACPVAFRSSGRADGISAGGVGRRGSSERAEFE